jgi:glucoamylase
VHTGGSFAWLDDPSFTHAQRYEDGADVLHTNVSGGGFGEVTLTDAIATDAPVLVRRVRGSTGRVGVYLRPELAGTVQAGGGYVDPATGALVLHRRDHVVAVGIDVDATAGVGERDRGSSADGALIADRLAGGGVVHGEVDGAILATAPADEVVVAIALGRTHAGALDRLRTALHLGAPAILDARRSAGAELLGALPAPLVDGAAGALERRSQLVFGAVADRATGGVLAAPEQDPWFARSGGYGFVWPRDLAFILLAHLASGRQDLAAPALWWLVRSQAPDGLWAQRSWTDGSLAPSWGTQLDETGAVLAAYGAAAYTLGDDRLARAIWTSTIHAADALVRTLDARTGLSAPSMDLWEERVGLHAYTAAATWAGLQAAAGLADRHEPARAGPWRAAAGRVRDGIETHLWSDRHGRYLRSIDVAREDAGGAPVPSCYELLADHPADPVGSVDPVDAVVDTSLLGLVYPFGVFAASEPRMAATIEAIEQQLRASDGGAPPLRRRPLHRGQPVGPHHPLARAGPPGAGGGGACRRRRLRAPGGHLDGSLAGTGRCDDRRARLDRAADLEPRDVRVGLPPGPAGATADRGRYRPRHLGGSHVAAPNVRTVELGQFTDENAERIAEQLEAAGIVWWHKSSGRFVRLLSAADWGTRIYVDRGRLDEARRIAGRITAG